MLRKYGISIDLNLYSVFDGVQQGVTIQDKSGKLVYANVRGAQLTGFTTAKQLLSATPKEIFSKFTLLTESGNPMQASELPGRKTLQNGKVTEKIVRFVIKKTNTEYWSLIKSQPLLSADKRIVGVINFFDDLTKVKKAENQYKFLAQMSATLSRSLSYEDRLSKFAEMTVPNFADWCAIDILDSKGQAVRLAVVHQDPAKIEISKQLWSNYPPDSKSRSGFYHILKRGKVEVYQLSDELLKAGVKDKRHLKLLKQLNLKSVAVMPLIARGKRLGLLSFGTAESGRRLSEDDIPFFRKLAERVSLLSDNARLYSALSRQMQQQKIIKNELEKSQQKFESVFHNSLLGMMIFDNEGRVREVNEALCVLLDRKPKSILKRRVSELLDVDDPDKFNLKWQDQQENVKQVGSAEWSDRDGGIKQLEYIVTNLVSPGLSLLTLRDITDQKIEEKRREHFLTITGHELKSPLATIKSISQLLKKQLPIHTKQVDEYLAQVDNKVETINRLVNDLLDVTRIRQGKLEFFYELMNVTELVRDIVKEITIVEPTVSITIRGSIKQDVVADRGRLSQVVRNLLGNAIKYSPKSKQITITLSTYPKMYKIEVEDHGSGIPASEQAKIFRLYYRSKQMQNSKGLGVGLFISSEIIKQMGGRLSVQSQLGQGSRFSFSLPLRPER
jgi:PAS domain S-box-containing protein